MLQLRGVIDGVERTFVLDRPETTIGRGDDNDIVLTDRVTSLHHASVRHADDGWWISDHASRYGVRVNGDVADETELLAGDVVTIGTVDLTVEPVPATPGPAGGPGHHAPAADDEDDDDDPVLLSADLDDLHPLDDVGAGIGAGAGHEDDDDPVLLAADEDDDDPVLISADEDDVHHDDPGRHTTHDAVPVATDPTVATRAATTTGEHPPDGPTSPVAEVATRRAAPDEVPPAHAVTHELRDADTAAATTTAAMSAAELPGHGTTADASGPGGGDGDDDEPVVVLGLVRPIEDFAVSLGFPGTESPEATPPVSEAVDDTPTSDSHAYSGLAVGYLSRLAHELRTAHDIDEAARRTLEVVFAALPVDRGWILFTDADGQITDRVERVGDTVAHPGGDLPISMSIVHRVLSDRVSVTTGDVAFDAGTASVSMMAHHIRAAMCAPLWSADQVCGVIYVDSLLARGAFTETALDLLTAMANYAAVAVGGLRHAMAAERERQARRHLERYHSPAMIEALQRREAVEGVSRLRQADVTVMFADVVGFTSVSEELSPDGVARLLDGFFTEAVEAVFAHGGTLDKFIGDAVMAFFGAPVAAHDHAEQAIRAALDLRFRVARWNQRQVDAGGSPIEIRMALNSGPVVVGDVGSSRRVDYTVLGNTVNVAARLEGVGGPGEIVLGAGTRDRLPADFPLEPLGEIDLRGLRHPIAVWRVATHPA